MRLFVTGAAGFLGRHTVAAALSRGHEVRAMVRPHVRTSPGRGLTERPGLEFVVADLRAGAPLDRDLDDVDAVIHLAGLKVGDLPTQLAGTVRPTEHLLAELRRSSVRRVVGVSSLAVYDFVALQAGEVLDEDAPVETDPRRRSPYAQAKLAQEQMFSALAAEHGFDVATLRPGMAYGAHHLWHDLLGIDVGPLHVRVGDRRRMPLVHVEHCAEALVRTAEVLADDPRPLVESPVNLIDPDPPTVGEYAQELGLRPGTRRVWRAPWWALRGVVAGIDTVNHRLFDDRAQLPSIASPSELHARFKPLQFSTERARTVLAWSPERSWREALAASRATERASRA